MDIISMVSELFLQLQENYINYLELISNKENVYSDLTLDEIVEKADKIKILILVLNREIKKLKTYKNNKLEYEYQKQVSEKNDNTLIHLNKIIYESVEILKHNNNIFKMSSTSKLVNTSRFSPRDLINFTIRINKNISSAEGLGSFIPCGFLNPFPLEETEMKSSFLKFNLDESSRLKMPVVNTEGLLKGSNLEIRYPEVDKDVFFRYVTDQNYIPTYFSGEIYNPTNPPVIEKNMILRVCSCKYGYLDSQINTSYIQVSEDIIDINPPSIKLPIICDTGPKRPSVMINTTAPGWEIPDINMDDSDTFSQFTPGSSSNYLVSLHRAESISKPNMTDAEDF